MTVHYDYRNISGLPWDPPEYKYGVCVICTAYTDKNSYEYKKTNLCPKCFKERYKEGYKEE
jgi:hypothetical protein